MRMEYLFLLPLLAALIITTTSVPVFASTGMSNCTEEPENDDCNPQPDRVGNDEENDEDAERDGADEQEDSNCWGQTTSDVVNAEDDGDSIGGDAFGQHSANPSGDADNDTPREGVGNQVEGHPSDHADSVGDNFGSDEECIDED
jgi:hypothetical protein